METEIATQARTGAPSGIGDEAATQNARFAFSLNGDVGDIEEEDCAGNGDLDGEGGATPRSIRERLVFRPLKIPVRMVGERGQEKEQSQENEQSEIAHTREA